MVGQRVIATIAQVEPYGVWFEYEGNRILVLVTDLPFKAPTRPPENGHYKGLLAPAD